MFREFDNLITDFINNIGVFAPILASLLIIVEAILPFLPLAVFVAFNFYYFGYFLGFLISWIMTCLGGYIVFKFWRYQVKNWVNNKINTKKNSKIIKLKDRLNMISLEKLVLLITIPFAPAFLINMIAGLSDISEKKFVTALIIGKIFLVYFWGFVGRSLIESFTNPYYLIIIGALLFVAFIISKFINRTYGIE